MNILIFLTLFNFQQLRQVTSVRCALLGMDRITYIITYNIGKQTLLQPDKPVRDFIVDLKTKTVTFNFVDHNTKSLVIK